jgi:hypothetical protein
VSIKTMSLVWDHSPQKGSSLILLLAIADYANEENRAWPSIGTLAAKIRMSERNTQMLLRKLIDAGELEIQQNAGPNGTNVYRIILGRGGENFAPGGEKSSTEGVKNSAQGGAIAIAPEPSLDPSVDPSVKEGAVPAQPAAAEPPAWYEADPPAPTIPPTPPTVRSLTQQPTVAMYRDVFLRYPSKAQMTLLLAHGVTDLRRWRAVLQHWCGRGWSPTNIAGMCDLYDHPERLEERQRPPQAAHRPSPLAPAPTPGADPAWQSSWDEWIAELSRPAGLGD